MREYQDKQRLKYGLNCIEIEDTSDCATCTQRDDDFWEMIQRVRFKCLGQVTCQGCGREYEAYTERDPNDA